MTHDSHECSCGCCSKEFQPSFHAHKGCNCPCHKAHSKYADALLHLADEAWMEVLKDKIKQEILKHSEENLNQLAKLVADTNRKRWVDKIDAKKNYRDFDEQLKDITSKQ